METIRGKLRKNREESPRILVHKTLGFIKSVAMAPIYLRDVTHVGERVRTLGKPRIENFGTMNIGNDVYLRSLHVPIELCTESGAVLSIGDGSRLNYGVSIGATTRVEIGARVRLAPYVMIVDSAFHDLYDRAARPSSRPVVIEDDVWIGAKASVLQGVHIGRGAVVGTSAVVTRDVPPFAVVAGVPAKVLKILDEDRFIISCNT